MNASVAGSRASSSDSGMSRRLNRSIAQTLPAVETPELTPHTTPGPAFIRAEPGKFRSVCTVVLRWTTGEPLRILAIRDEFVSRDFDPPGAWWPEQQGVIGGRDRLAGGSWCVSDPRTDVTALVL